MRNAAGDSGERAAEVYLCERLGFTILARNWRNPRDLREELDLVCRDGDILVFVEVKARAGDALVPGYFAVDRRKRAAVRRAARAYLAGLAKMPRTFRFDVVEVATAPAPEVLHFENVPLFGKDFRGR